MSDDELAKRMLALLPQDGTPVLNRVMRVMLGREVEETIDPDRFFKARDLLLNQGRIGRLRGQGGQLFLTVRESADEQEPPAITVGWSEARLMEPLRIYLSKTFSAGLDLPKGSLCLIEDTSTLGPAKRGRWARPDFILVSATKLMLLPGAQVDVHSFELKTETGVTNLAVYEALAQTRFTHFGHLVWHLPEKSKNEASLAEIEEQCHEHGIGLIRIFDPEKPEKSEILLDPARKGTLPLRVEDFLQSRLKTEDRKKLAQIVNGGGA